MTDTHPTVEPWKGEGGLRFLVRSRSRPISFLVDLAANDFLGGCGCENHQFYIQPQIDKGNRYDESGQPLNCWHIRAAQQWLLNKLMPQIAEAMT